MSRLLLVLGVLLLVPACTATIEPPEAKVVVPAVDLHSGPEFCPPGHAKKGWC